MKSRIVTGIFCILAVVVLFASLGHAQVAIIAAQHFVFSNDLIGSSLRGVLELGVLQALQDQVQIGRFDLRGGRIYL
jgi:hypothetical protein